MKRLLLTLFACVVLWPSVPLSEPRTSTIELKKPASNYTARATRQHQRAVIRLQQLPTKWQRLAWCESRQQLHAVNDHTYYGLWQIHKGWFKQFDINPRTATLEQQYRVARHVYRKQGAAAWTCAKRSNFQ